MIVPFWDPKREYKHLKHEVNPAMQSVLERGDLILRKDVLEFEGKFAKYVGTKYCVSVASGTDALILSLRAAGIGLGDKVMVPSYTFRATVEAVVHAYGTPVLYDLDGTFNVTTEVKAFIPVHMEGKVSMYPGFAEDIAKAGITVIEDACQAVGAAPVTGLAACYSFYPAKILGCYGDGGAICTNNFEFAEKLRKMRNHYKDDWGAGFGYNSRLDNIQAAVLNIKMRHLKHFIKCRKTIAQQYDAGLEGTGLLLPEPREVYQDYIVGTTKAKELHEFLKEKGIETMLNYYPFPDMTPKLPKALEYEQNTLRLPCTPYHKPEEIQYVIDSIKEFTQ